MRLDIQAETFTDRVTIMVKKQQKELCGID